MRISDFVSFSLNRESPGQPVSKAELKDVASRLATALEKRGFDVGDIFGSSTDLWGFSVATEACEILVDVSPPEITTNKLWGIQVLLWDPGWLRATRERRLGELKRVEWAVHEALLNDLLCRDLVWFLGKGKVSDRATQPTP